MPERLRRALWFVALWAGGVAVTGLVVAALRGLIAP